MLRRVLLAAALASLAAPLAAAPEPQPVAPAARWFTVGSVRVAALHDAELLIANDGKVFGTYVGPAAVAEVLAAAGVPTDTVRVSANALLIRLPGRTVLIDTGLGPKAHGQLIASLAVAGVTPGEITDVLLTHSHGDHVGGLIDADGKRAFPNAKVRLAQAEWGWLQRNAGAQALVDAITPQVEAFAPGATVVPGIVAIAVPGHTPGHVAYELTSGGVRLRDIGDTAHSTIVSLARPDWLMGFDRDPSVGRASRRAALTGLAASGELIFAPHFPYPGVGTVAAQGDGFVWLPRR